MSNKKEKKHNSKFIRTGHNTYFSDIKLIPRFKKNKSEAKYLIPLALTNGVILAGLSFAINYAIVGIFNWPFLVAGAGFAFILGTITGLLCLGFTPLTYNRKNHVISNNVIGNTASLLILIFAGSILALSLICIFGPWSAVISYMPMLGTIFGIKLSNPFHWMSVALVSAIIVAIPAIIRLINNLIYDKHLQINDVKSDLIEQNPTNSALDISKKPILYFSNLLAVDKNSKELGIITKTNKKSIDDPYRKQPKQCINSGY